jgi:hypothetical protein
MLKSLLPVVVLTGQAFSPSAYSQVADTGANTVAVGADVGFLASDNPDRPDGSLVLQSATGSADAFVEYYYTPRASFRAMYGWAAPEIESAPRAELRRQQVNVVFIYNWRIGPVRPFAFVGGGAYFIAPEGANGAGDSVTKPGGTLGWGCEYHLRTFAVRSEMAVHVLGDEASLPTLAGQTLSAFTWTFGFKVPF